MDLLRQGLEEAAAELAVANPRAMRPLVARLWDPDPEIRRRAAGALGRSAEAHPGLGLETVRRLMWALNDESATNGVYGIPALGEIGRRCPGTLAPFVSSLASMAWDAGIRLELLRALARIAEADPKLVAAQVDRLREHVDTSSDEELRAWRRLIEITEEGHGERN